LELCEDWVGSSGTNLARKWGPPESVFELANGSAIWTYSKQRSHSSRRPVWTETTYNSNPYTGEVTAKSVSTGGHTTTTVNSCETRVEVSAADVVADVRFKGKLCRAPPKPKPHMCREVGPSRRIESVQYTPNGKGQYELVVRLSRGPAFPTFVADVDREHTFIERRGKTTMCFQSGIGPYLFFTPANVYIVGEFR